MTAREAIDILVEKNEAGELDDAIAYMEEYADVVDIAQKHRLFVEIDDGGKPKLVQMVLINQEAAQEPAD